MAQPQPQIGQMKLSLQMERRIYPVSELNRAVQRLFEGEFQGIWVVGEISGLRAASSGHYYFSLKDDQSQIKCALFKGAARYVKFKPQEGLSVLVRGNLEVYEARGEYQLIVESLEPQGVGALQLAFEQLKRKLAAEGLFDSSRKRPLPKFPQRIGIITSPAGAVIRDMLHVLERRFAGLHIRLYPAQVQGEGSAEQVCRALDHFTQRPWADVVIIARGGGSIEDLWTFNEESVARAIAASAIPTISAIGHETDFTIADFVADHRAPTPSAAAEIVICTRDSLLDQVAGRRAKLVQSLRYRLLVSGRQLQELSTRRAAVLVHRAVTHRSQQVDDLDYRLRHAQRDRLNRARTELSRLDQRLRAADLRLRFADGNRRLHLASQKLIGCIQSRLVSAQHAHGLLTSRISHLNPTTVLERGYAIVHDSAGHILRSSSQAAAGEPLNIRLAEGSLAAVVADAALQNKAKVRN